MYAAVLCSFYPHLTPRLFLYQHFVTLKSRSFQATAWLCYDTQFRLKLAANNSWDFNATTLQASRQPPGGNSRSPVRPRFLRQLLPLSPHLHPLQRLALTTRLPQPPPTVNPFPRPYDRSFLRDISNTTQTYST